MAARPSWQGHLKLSLVTCPVALYTATTSANDIRFHLINPETNNRIRLVPTDPDTGPVERSDLVKGYEVERDEYVLFQPEDFEKVRLESTRTITIDRFVDEADIDRLYWDDPFFVTPDAKGDIDAFVVIREAMKTSGKVALGTLVLRGKERQLAIEVRGKGLIAYTLRARDEVKSADEFFDDIPDAKPDKDMVEIAKRILGQKEGPFDPEQFVDRYDEALREMIEAKRKGERIVSAPEPDDTNVVDLMAALRASLKGGAEPAPRRKSGSARSAAKTPAAKKKAAPRKKAG
ncbi:Ku protein [Brevundimonas sp. 2R-24]|uniref:Non-homologous end joining protein Ku n=1 Tax=Peiella sedimenti TaxID=3061083 RepID=A0ABT8SNL0_9CAUL|nr:Ku protein [Caulobacteraceae bacterium XZ-24]